ncbi:hypothetical protein GURKE_00890 [Brevundimonas phage vB_BpoS-Gurke]|uniref:Uncharacterized protein n=1 Tax=Brevundimonas phage vB_BpoS-Gurke TaxID=2948599 RepID=A0A9E7N3D1_9CAUD|nr:hypothetical protein GURKE_00890 [Brevundimonas phage vB_BpoS-Gurke]
MNNTFDPALSFTLNTLLMPGRKDHGLKPKPAKPTNGHQAVMNRDGNILSVRFGAART